jgi:2,4-diketo-3-deoxy-L-fuconate hydrolase
VAESNEPFRLINYQSHEEARNGGKIAHVGLVLDDYILPLEALAEHHRAARSLSEVSVASELTPGVQGLLTNWAQSFHALCELTAFVTGTQVEEAPWRGDRLFLLDEVHVLAPVLRPTKMLFAGMNYQRHVKEIENWHSDFKYKPIDKAERRPFVFLKLPYSIIGPYDPVSYPHPYHQLDWEGELAVVIGKRGKHIPVEQAMNHIAGFTVVNDYSLRELQTVIGPIGEKLQDWFGGKNFDTSAALGPYLVPRQFVPDYLNLRMRLTVNGVVKQECTTQEMVFTPDEIIAFASSVVTLEPGDVIATGSPPGAGFATGKYLEVGDVVEAEVEGLGRQRNVIIE